MSDLSGGISHVVVGKLTAVVVCVLSSHTRCAISAHTPMQTETADLSHLSHITISVTALQIVTGVTLHNNINHAHTQLELVLRGAHDFVGLLFLGGVQFHASFDERRVTLACVGVLTSHRQTVFFCIERLRHMFVVE